MESSVSTVIGDNMVSLFKNRIFNKIYQKWYKRKRRDKLDIDVKEKARKEYYELLNFLKDKGVSLSDKDSTYIEKPSPQPQPKPQQPQLTQAQRELQQEELQQEEIRFFLEEFEDTKPTRAIRLWKEEENEE